MSISDLPLKPAAPASFSRSILSVFAVVLGVALVGSVLGIWSLNRVEQETDRMVSQGEGRGAAMARS